MCATRKTKRERQKERESERKIKTARKRDKERKNKPFALLCTIFSEREVTCAPEGTFIT